jgi:lipopolysaccharide/colanic/teichoic acid biosynthesis glycosyltransferase
MEIPSTQSFSKSMTGHPRTRETPFTRAAKRSLDVVLSSLGIFIFSPFLFWIAWRIRRDSPGPVFYRGLRQGRNGKPFYILKFRTMYETTESYAGPRVTASDDPRVTPYGRWLRATKLNELPQFWNVLKGEMSLVGPRPEDVALGEQWPADIKAEVLSVRPGITSPASVIYRHEESLLNKQKNGNPGGERPVTEAYLNAVLPSKLRLDQLYVRNHSLLLDLDILFWTGIVFLQRLERVQPDEQDLFVGPISNLFRRYLNWFALDTLVTLVAMGLTGLIWRSMGPLNVGWLRSIAMALAFAVLFSLSGAALGTPRIDWSRAAWSDMFDLILPAGLATGLALLGNWWLGGQAPLFPPAMVLVASFLALLGFILVRYRGQLLGALAARWLKVRGEAHAAQERVLIIGGGQTGQFAAWVLGNGGGAKGYRVAGFVDDDLYKQGMRLHGLQVLGRREDIPNLVQEKDIGLLVFAIHNINENERKRVLDICAATPARVVMMPDILSMMQQSGLQPTGLGDHLIANEKIDAHQHKVENREIPTAQLASWLDALDSAASSGDIAQVQRQISSYRDQLQQK